MPPPTCNRAFYCVDHCLLALTSTDLHPLAPFFGPIHKQDPKVVISVLMKLAGGSPSFAGELNIDAFLEQVCWLGECLLLNFLLC